MHIRPVQVCIQPLMMLHLRCRISNQKEKTVLQNSPSKGTHGSHSPTQKGLTRCGPQQHPQPKHKIKNRHEICSTTMYSKQDLLSYT